MRDRKARANAMGRRYMAAVARRIAAMAAGLILVAAVVILPTAAQQAPQGVPGITPAPATGDEPPQIKSRPALRILTDSDFPPFNFIDEDGGLTGFNVDLARAICLETGAACDVQAKPWEELIPALLKGEADAVMAGHAITSRVLRQVDFTDRYFHTPARFVMRRTGPEIEATPDGLDGKRIGVAKDTAHEAFVRTFFRDSRIEVFPTADLTRDALVAGKIDAILDDAISLSFWLGGTSSRDCCMFRGGAFFEPKYFGEGLAIAIAKGDPDLRRLLNAALKKVRASGRYEELVQRYFPNRVY